MVETYKLHPWGYKEDIRLCDQSHLNYMYILYCPRQVSMGIHTSRIKNWGWAVIRRKCLIGSIISMQVLTPDAKLAARCTESTHIAASPMLCQGLPDSRESLSCLKVNLLIAKLSQCSSLVVHANLVLQARNAVNEAMDRCVWNFTVGCHGVWSPSERSQLCT